MPHLRRTVAAMTAAEDWHFQAMRRNPPLPAIASQWDRVCLDPGSRPTVPPCERCAPERYAAADREQRQRHYITDIEAELAAANRELARLRRTYEPTTEEDQ